MTYVCSDIHGCSDQYFDLLDAIQLGHQDHLYVLGDVVDREGSGGIDILQDIMGRPNIRLILGNHEHVALEGMEILMNLSSQNIVNIDDLPDYVKVEMTEWINLGGMPTIDAFRALPYRDKERLTRFLSDQCFTYAELTVNGTDYVLCHDESFYGDVYDAVLITGHTPTRFMDNNPRPDYIWREENHWHIDCGCGYGGQLGALCLETGKEFYI